MISKEWDQVFVVTQPEFTADSHPVSVEGTGGKSGAKEIHIDLTDNC